MLDDTIIDVSNSTHDLIAARTAAAFAEADAKRMEQLNRWIKLDMAKYALEDAAEDAAAEPEYKCLVCKANTLTEKSETGTCVTCYRELGPQRRAHYRVLHAQRKSDRPL